MINPKPTLFYCAKISFLLRKFSVELSIKVWKKEEEFVASCPELDVFCYGIDRNQAMSRLRKVIVFYANTATDLGYKIDPVELLSSFDHKPSIRSEISIN